MLTMVSMLIGTCVPDLFGISLAILRNGGDMLVATTGWRLLHAEENDALQMVWTGWADLNGFTH
jgi:small neutral amino acid transporter SnatA (MarC family)